MMSFSRRLALAVGILALAGCNAPSSPAAPPAASSGAPRESLGRMLERYWDERVDLEDVITPQVLADARAVERRYLDELGAYERTDLDAESRLNYDIFKRQREIVLEGFTYPEELLPLDPFSAPPLKLAELAADAGQHPWSAAEAAAFLKRADASATWAQQAIVNLKEGLRRGYVTPKSVAERMLPLLDRLGKDFPVQPDWQGLPEAERASWARRLDQAINARLRPALRLLHDYLQHAYLPKTRAGLSLAELPLGADWYAYRVRRATDSGMSAPEVHRQASAELERLRLRWQALAPAAPVVASPNAAPLSDVLAGYVQLNGEVEQKLGSLFPDKMPLPLDVLGTVMNRRPGLPLDYLPPSSSGAGRGPGLLLVVSQGPSGRLSVPGFLNFALPGIHYLESWQRGSALPRFRRLGSDEAFVAGWGAYAVSLGEELNLYPDEASKREALAMQMRCAAAAVVDTGIQAMGWTAARALDYLHEQLIVDDAEARALIDGYVASPGSALSCAIGELKLQSIKARAQQTLGGRFDAHEFYGQILKDGAMPLDILDAKIKAWLDSRR